MTEFSGGGGSDLLLFDTKADLTVDLGAPTPMATGEGLDLVSGIERVLTGAGKDRIRGSQGRDILGGGQGDDTLTGNLGADIFCFSLDSGADRITDFDLDEDRINLWFTFVYRFADLLFTETEDGVWIDARARQDPQERVFLQGVRAAELDRSHFIFGDYLLA